MSMPMKWRIHLKGGECDGWRHEIDNPSNIDTGDPEHPGRFYAVWPGHDQDIKAAKDPQAKISLHRRLATLAYEFAGLIPSPIDGVPEFVYERRPALDKPESSPL